VAWAAVAGDALVEVGRMVIASRLPPWIQTDALAPWWGMAKEVQVGSALR